MYIRISFFLMFGIVITVNNAENKFPVFGKSGSKLQNTEDPLEALKAESKRYVTICGGENSQEEILSESNNNQAKRNSSNDGNNWGGYDNNNQYSRNPSNWNENSNNNRGNNRPDRFYGNSGSNRDNWNNRETVHSHYGSSWDNPIRSYGSYGHGSNSRDDMRRNRSGYGSYDYGHRISDGYGNDKSRESGRGSDDMGGRGSYDSFTYGGSYVRSKRSGTDMECTAQCVLGYLEVLDDNRSPSELALIKWLQAHIPNNGKRIRALRESRRCFAKLAASDNEDGCDFSRRLSDCLSLELDEK